MSEWKGSYIEDFRRLVIAAAVAGEAGILIGAKGFGKTSYLKAALAKIVGGKEAVLKMEFASSSQQKILDGHLNYKKLAQDKEWEMDVTETIHNPIYRGALWDEYFRSNDVIFDLGIHNIPTEDEDKDRGTINIFTANFAVTGERNEPVLDRISLWFWVDAAGVNMDEILDEQIESIGGTPDVGSGFPSLAEIENIRQQSLTPRAVKAVKRFIRDLRIVAERGIVVEDKTKNFPVNPRLQKAWVRIFARLGIYYAKSNDFETLPAEARLASKYAYQNTTKEDYLDWIKLITPIMLDPIDAACQDAKRDAFKAFKQAKSIQDIRQRAEQLGSALQLAYSNLDALGSDPRIDQTKNEIQESFINYLTGKDVYESGTEG